ncbi:MULTISPECIES: hypothetical protein [Moorena]|uniref:hypothetical protein n=1 Tax=Moorena TaxID=1155738 RepID=UPI0013B9E01B|nr:MULTISPECIES: hypothetical protein [Moorena]NEQ06700.1 hypothetical protein [Moorena sp. SIO4E2]NER89757.1 hypothetical protein [Moorena sp. SIO3A2]NES46282.1 hypothetical protein [Moorena sp. SIO2C4]
MITLQNYKMFFDHYTEYQGFQRVNKCFASSIASVTHHQDDLNAITNFKETDG